MVQVLCPRCEVGSGALKKKLKMVLEGSQHSMKKTATRDPMSDVESALSECREFASSVSAQSPYVFTGQPPVLVPRELRVVEAGLEPVTF